jgi:uncharacterized Rossmann fold enzyme
MRWEDWQDTYRDIVTRLGLNSDDDRRASKLLASLLSDVDSSKLLERLKQTIVGKTVVICGAGPSLKRHMLELRENPEYSDAIYVAVDGAASAFVELNHRCDIVVTDLDGDIDHIRQLIHQGAIGIIHAHGDNMDTVANIVPKLGSILGSTQVEPRGNVFLWGGFTDGDRACFIVMDYSPSLVVLAGMDFGDMVGRWSKPDQDHDFPASERKRVKLEIAKQLITELKEKGTTQFVILN